MGLVSLLRHGRANSKLCWLFLCGLFCGALERAIRRPLHLQWARTEHHATSRNRVQICRTCRGTSSLQHAERTVRHLHVAKIYNCQCLSRVKSYQKSHYRAQRVHVHEVERIKGHEKHKLHSSLNSSTVCLQEHAMTSFGVSFVMPCFARLLRIV